MKLNDRGFAVSGIIYSILILFLVLIFAVLTVLGSRKMILDKLKNDVMTELNSGEVKEVPNLIDTLLSQYTGASTGLLRDSANPDIYYYKGTEAQVGNNYLWYGGHHWRIVEFDVAERTLTLISTQPLTSISASATTWTSEETFLNSYLGQWMNGYFYSSLAPDIQDNIVDTQFNVGMYNNVTGVKATAKVGVLDETQYTRAGGSTSYLNINDYYWLANKNDTTGGRNVSPNGTVVAAAVGDARGLRVVMKINDISVSSGNGSLSSSFKTDDRAITTSNVQIGEYIKVPTTGSYCGTDKMCTFRVVSKDNDSIKVVLNGLINTTSSYGSTSTITTSHTIYSYLNTFANGISTTYRYTSNKTFYIGDYLAAASYETIKDETLSANVGLPVIGEIFSGNDIDLSYSMTKNFVDVNTIENPSYTSSYWTMNRYNSSTVRYVNVDGPLNSSSQSNYYGVRPVIFLKSNLNFTGGSGTAQDPYTVS